MSRFKKRADGQMSKKAPSYRGLRPSSKRASRAAAAASKKMDTKCEVALRRALHAQGCRFRKNVDSLPGTPDVVFTKARIAVFCDGDYWHGRHWEVRRQKLEKGHNARYWVAKIARNMERDRQRTELLEVAGWTVIRLWETDILADAEGAAAPIIALLRARGHFSAT